MLKRLRQVLKYNFKNIILFELIFKVITVLVASPLFMRLFNLIMQLNGFEYLTMDNILDFLMLPSTLISAGVLVILVTCYVIFDVSTIIILVDASMQKKSIRLLEAIKIAIKKSLLIIKPRNILLSILTIILIPFLKLGVSSSFISSLPIPQFIMDYIMNNAFLMVINVIFTILYILIVIKWIYTLNFYILEDEPFKEAKNKSIKLGENSHLKDFLSIIGTQIVTVLLFICAVVIGTLLLLTLQDLLKNYGLAREIIVTLISLFIIISYVSFSLLSIPFTYICISILYYKHKDEKFELLHHIDFKKNKIKSYSGWSLFKFASILLAIIGGGVLVSRAINGDYDIFMVNHDVENVRITAHRGASRNYPENTFAAFNEAKNLAVDWVELDVQQTKDGKLIVMHDKNFKRTTGLNKNTYDVKYKEIKDLDAGSYMNVAFSNERIPLFENVVAWAKENNIYLNIELKPTGKEKDFEQSVIDIIDKYDYKNSCVIASFSYDVLKNVKEIDITYKTAYIISYVYGDIASLEYADIFSIEHTNVNRSLVNKIHAKEKEIYVWTINDEEIAKNMIYLNVDNIITDDVTMVKHQLEENKRTNIIVEYIKKIENFFK